LTGRRIPEHVLDEIRARTDIVEVVSRHVPLKKAGRSHKGLCPFHSEKTPSFHVNAERGFYHCFGCGEGGSVFDFVMKVEGLSFIEAAERLARTAGVTLPQQDDGPEARREMEERDRLLRVNVVAQEFMRQRLLQGDDAAVARTYLADRGLDPRVLEAYGVGFAGLDWQGLTNHLQRVGVAASDAECLGLIGRSASGRPYDRLRGRITFPIHGASDRIVGFGARVVPALEAAESGRTRPKYVNSPESPVYAKGRVLFGLQLARDAIRRSGAAVIVEGYMDAIALHQAGVMHVVAPCGTALTDEQLRTLRRLASRVYVTFDGDDAGARAAERAAGLTVEAGMLSGFTLGDRQVVDARVVSLPAGDDPDTFVQRHGADAFRGLLDRARPVVEYHIERAAAAAGETVTARVAAARALKSLFSRIPQGIARDEYMRLAAERLGLDEQALRRELRPEASAASAAGPTPTRTPEVPAAATGTDTGTGTAATTPPASPFEEKVVAFLLEWPQFVTRAAGEGLVEMLRSADLRRMTLRIIAEVRAAGGVGDGALTSAHQLVNECLREPLRGHVLRELGVGSGYRDGAAAENWFDLALARLRREDAARPAAAIQNSMARSRLTGDGLDVDAQLRLAQEKLALRLAAHGLLNPRSERVN
jgi:DNA primase